MPSAVKYLIWAAIYGLCSHIKTRSELSDNSDNTSRNYAHDQLIPVPEFMTVMTFCIVTILVYFFSSFSGFDLENLKNWNYSFGDTVSASVL